jgi:hypothetical protein
MQLAHGSAELQALVLAIETSEFSSLRFCYNFDKKTLYYHTILCCRTNSYHYKTDRVLMMKKKYRDVSRVAAFILTETE